MAEVQYTCVHRDTIHRKTQWKRIHNITIRVHHLQSKQKHTKHTTIYSMIKIEPKNVKKCVKQLLSSKRHMIYISSSNDGHFLYTWVRVSWIEFNNCPTRCDLFSLLHFSRQLYMFRLLTPIIRSWYSCNYSFWYWKLDLLRSTVFGRSGYQYQKL